jgi:hypothetical protein
MNSPPPPYTSSTPAYSPLWIDTRGVDMIRTDRFEFPKVNICWMNDLLWQPEREVIIGMNPIVFYSTIQLMELKMWKIHFERRFKLDLLV